MTAIALPKRTLDYLACGAKEGRRHAELLAAAAQFRDAGAPVADAERELSQRATDDGLSQREATSTIRSAYQRPARQPIVSKEEFKARIPTPEEEESQRQRLANLKLAQKARYVQDQIFKEFAADPDYFIDQSPYTLNSEPADDWRLILSLFHNAHCIWIGDYTDTCPEDCPDPLRRRRAAAHFRTVEQWLTLQSAPGQHICPSVFKPGILSRSAFNVLSRPILVIESDSLSKPQICGVFRWVQQFTRLRAIVDTGGKSLHGWFDMPNLTTFNELSVILPAIGCDKALFNPAQPCRLAGARRGPNFQKLIYFDL